MDETKNDRPPEEGSGGHSSERIRHQDREDLREGGEGSLLDREGEAAQEYAVEERAYSVDFDAREGGAPSERVQKPTDREDDPSRRRGERS